MLICDIQKYYVATFIDHLWHYQRVIYEYFYSMISSSETSLIIGNR